MQLMVLLQCCCMQQIKSECVILCVCRGGENSHFQFLSLKKQPQAVRSVFSCKNPHTKPRTKQKGRAASCCGMRDFLSSSGNLGVLVSVTGLQTLLFFILTALDSFQSDLCLCCGGGSAEQPQLLVPLPQAEH